jgi:hypothetical protein
MTRLKSHANKEKRVLPESSGVFLLVQMLFGPSRRAYSHGLGESVTRGDRRRRELVFGRPSPPLASPCE